MLYAFDWTYITFRGLVAHGLSNADNEGMIFIEQPFVRRERIHEEPLDLVIGRLLGHDPMSCQDSPRVGVDDEGRFLEAVKQDAVRLFGTDASDSQELFPQSFERFDPHPFKIAPII